MGKKKRNNKIFEIKGTSSNGFWINVITSYSIHYKKLYEDGQQYYYRGEDPNNYIEIEGILFRIISVDENKNIKVISNDSLYSINWNIESLTKKNYNILEEDNSQPFNLNTILPKFLISPSGPMALMFSI